MDTGIAHKRGTERRVMYRLQDLPVEGIPLLDTPTSVWPVEGGEIEKMSLRSFNESYIVDYRFDLSRLAAVSG